jgi:two-component system sensor histidine kinase KdpD
MENEYSERAREEAAALMKNEQLRTTLLRSISHDLRTPLTSIYGNADNLLADSDRMDEETKKEIYRDIREDSYWLISVVQNLLSVTRLENKELKLNKDIELIDDVIGEALQHSDRSVGNRRVIFEPGGENLFVEADAALIEQVIINLVNNAIKYTPDGSEIRIETSGTEQEVLVSVSDNGPGVAEEELSKLFELFYMGDRTGADSRRGLGLGLGVCQSIVEAHEGSIHAQNLEPHGLRIWFSLPKKEIILDGNGNI